MAYSLSVRLVPSEEESKLFEKYAYSQRPFFVCEVGKVEDMTQLNFEGPTKVSFGSLTGGETRTSEELLVVFTQIPTVTGETLVKMKAELVGRESWHGNNEDIEI
ncbi:MAG: hypothetical protein KAV99_00715 [Candidatus Latescibacteria bacterium]|nr:hypothetical protein [Candidatus Latescibacterota bacterium]